MVSDWSRRIALMASGIHLQEEPKEKNEGTPLKDPPNPVKRKRKRNQQDRFHSHIETHRHPSLNRD